MEGRLTLFGMPIDRVTQDQAILEILRWVAEPFTRTRFVVTPNVNHVVLYQSDDALRRAYAAADLIVADGKPVVWVSRLRKNPLPEAVPGSDLAPALFGRAEARSRLTLFLLGSSPAVVEQAANNIEQQWLWVRVVGAYSPPLGFEYSQSENAGILAYINAVRPDVLIVGLGAPKQETWVYEHSNAIRAKAVMCLGATIDFLAGAKPRAPRWMRRAGLEWLYRVCLEPRRLIRRYARDAFIFPRLVWREWKKA